MLNKFMQDLNNIDKVTYTLIIKGIKYSFGITILSAILLLFYLCFTQNITLYYVGLLILKSSFFFSAFTIICGISMDTIKKQI